MKTIKRIIIYFLRIILISIIFIIPFVSLIKADNVVIGTGSAEICLNDEECFFYLPNPSIIYPSEGGGAGATLIIYKDQISYDLCYITYDLANRNIINVSSLLNFSRDTVQIYVNNWQLICSDLVNKSLNEPLICKKISNYKDYNLLKDDLDAKINISDNLLSHYIQNYDDLCLKTGLSIVPIKENNSLFYVFIIISIIGLTLLVIIKRKQITRIFIKSSI